MNWILWLQKTKLFDRFILAMATLVTACFGLEVLTYMGMWENRIGVPVWGMAGGVLLLGVVWRGWRRGLPSALADYSMVIGTVLVGLGLGLRYLDKVVYANFVFSTFHVQSMALVAMGVWFGLLSFLFWSRPKIWRQSWWLAALPLWLLGATLGFGLLYPIPYYELSKEDSVVEYLTALAYALSGVCALLAAGRLWRRRTTTPSWRLLLLGIFLVGFLGLTGIAGEEISWGQRIVGFSTPEEIAEVNTQGEFNIHNNELVFGQVYRAYGLLTIGAIGAALARFYWQRLKLPQQWSDLGQDFLQHFAPHLVLIGWFIPMLIFVVLRERISQAYLNPWEEVIEGFLSVGVLLTLAEKAGFTWLTKK